MKNFDPNRLFYKMAKAYAEAKKAGYRLTICNEGGSRSSKTFDAFHLIIAICAHNINAELDIYILRDTLTNNKDYTYKDFRKVISICGVGENAQFSNPQKPYCNLYGNNIYFRGLDDEKNTEGYPSDILFINEVLETKKAKVEGLLMRCRKLVLFDWNPKLTKHWIFDYEGRPNVLFTHSTYKDNKHLEQTVIDEIESYNPEIPENVKNKTANLFRWKVYGLGVRADQEGNVFNDSQLNKYNPDEIDLSNAVKLAWCDVADQGTDYLCFIVGALVGEKVYVVDVIFTPQGSEETERLIYQLLKKHNIQNAVFESNNQGLMYTKSLIKEINMIEAEELGVSALKHNSPLTRVIGAIPSTTNKHSRITIQAKTNIIPNFYFRIHRTGMYAEYYDMLTNYKHDKSVKEDDAPDATAGLSYLVTFNL